MLKNKIVIFMASVPWQWLWQRQHEWASRLAKDNQVFYVEPIGMTNHGPLKILKKLGEFFQRNKEGVSHKLKPEIDKNLHHVSVFFIPWHNLAWLNRLNAWLIKKQLSKKIAVQADLETSDGFLFWICNPTDTIVSLLKHFPRTKVIYDIAMRFLKLPDAPKYLKHSQDQLAQRADLIIYDAEASLQDLPSQTHAKAHFIPQGVNDIFFENHSSYKYEHLENIPHPRICYMGALNQAVDVPLIKKIAKRFPSFNLVIVGQVDSMSAELKTSNIHFTGKVPHADLPALLRKMDVGLIPYLVNDYTAGTFPTKIFEYLSAGLPVVSTALPELIRYREKIFVAPDYELFIEALKNAVDHGKAELDLDFLKKQTWSHRFKEIESLIQS